ncbi:hypothetical protein C8R43DRAFT_959383 [Mycena crocata]|nr:hypothetical protein C8R43DRAFT_959383 [Mycena crocata]
MANVTEALDDVRSGAPHGEIVQGWLDIQRCPAGWTHRRVALFQRVARRAALKKRPSKPTISLGRSDAERLTWMDALKKRVEARVERKKRVAAICERRERGLARLSRVSPHLLPTHTDTNTVSSAAEARLAREQEADAQARRERVEYVETLRRAGLAKQQAAKSTRGLTGKSLLDVRKAVCEWENDKVLFPAENIRPSDTVCLAVEGEALQVVTALPAKRATSRVRVLRRETGDHNELVQSRDEADAVHEFLKLVFKIALRSVSGGSNEGWSDIRLGSVGHPKSCPDGARDIGCLHVETCYVGGRLADESEGYGGSEIVVGLGIVKFHSDNGSRSDEDGEVLRRSSDLLEGGEKFPVTDIDGVMVEITKSERGYALLATKKLDHIVDYRGPGRENFQGLGGCKIVDETDYIN